ncbi:MAG: response regulator transcription factor [Eubacterium sp.]|nr:response regulator transcription factor [Eubacterium sp.]
MQLSIAVMDDLQCDRDHLLKEIEDYFLDKPEIEPDIRSYQSADEMLAAFKPGTIQLAMLDICMEGLNGIELARQLRLQDTGLLIVFLTTSRDYVFDAFPLHPFDYIVKPYSSEKLQSVLDEVCRTLFTGEPELILRVPHGTLKVLVKNVVSAVSSGHYVEVHTLSGQRLRCLMTFTELYNILKEYPCFMLCNRGILINMDHALSLKRDEISMTDGSSYSLRIRKRSELVTQFSQYQLSRIKRR